MSCKYLLLKTEHANLGEGGGGGTSPHSGPGEVFLIWKKQFQDKLGTKGRGFIYIKMGRSHPTV